MNSAARRLALGMAVALWLLPASAPAQPAPPVPDPALLLAAGAGVNLRAKDGCTALEAAEMIGDDEIMELLKRAGAKE
jgi:hypothetical protein